MFWQWNFWVVCFLVVKVYIWYNGVFIYGFVVELFVVFIVCILVLEDVILFSCFRGRDVEVIVQKILVVVVAQFKIMFMEVLVEKFVEIIK